MKNVIHLLTTKAENYESKARATRRLLVSPSAWEGYKREAENLETLAKECRLAVEILKAVNPSREKLDVKETLTLINSALAQLG